MLRRITPQVSVVNSWLEELDEEPLPAELLLVIKEFISDWECPAHPNPKHLRASATIAQVTNAEVAHVVGRCQESKEDDLTATATVELEATSRPYFEIDQCNASKIRCIRQEFEPAHCQGAQSFEPGHKYHVQLCMTSGKAVEGHQQMQLIGTADGPPHGPASNDDGKQQMSFSCSTEAFPRVKSSKEGSTAKIDILIDLPRNSDRPILKRLQVGTVSVRSEGGHRQLMLRAPFLPLKLYALVLCDSEGCVACGVGTRIEVVFSETVTKDEFKRLQATQVERIPQRPPQESASGRSV